VAYLRPNLSTGVVGSAGRGSAATSYYELSHIPFFGCTKRRTRGSLKPMTGPRHSSDVLVAGVPWPRHKLFAVIAGFVTLVLVAALTTSAAPSVLGGTAVAIVVGLVLKALAHRPDGLMR